MLLADIIVGYFVPNLIGWFFFIAVVLIEGALISKTLHKTYSNKEAYKTSLIANLITTLIGFILGQTLVYDAHSFFGHIINWIPVDYYRGSVRPARTLAIFVLSFLLTLVFETLILIFRLKKHNLSKKEVFRISLRVNAMTYALSGVVLLIFILAI